MEASEDKKGKLTAAALFVCAAVSIAWTLLSPTNVASLGGGSSWDRPLEVVADASPLAFLCAAVLLFYRPRFGYHLGLAAGLMALPWFVLTEVSLHWWNSWIFLNSEEAMNAGGAFPAAVVLRILFAVFTVWAVACSTLRLLAARWLAWKARTWPAFAAGLLVQAVWFAGSVIPYSVPGFDHPAHAWLRMLHVQKRGLRFQETTASLFRDGRVWILRTDRRLFQYRFEGQAGVAGMWEVSQAWRDRGFALAQSPGLWKLRTPPAKPMRAWNAEGWYVVLKDTRLLAFTTEYGTVPPREVTDLFHEIEQLPVSEERPFAARDVCLGFCYDPVAALGFSVLPQRTRLLRSEASASSGGLRGAAGSR